MVGTRGDSGGGRPPRERLSLTALRTAGRPVGAAWSGEPRRGVSGPLLTPRFVQGERRVVPAVPGVKENADRAGHDGSHE